MIPRIVEFKGLLNPIIVEFKIVESKDCCIQGLLNLRVVLNPRAVNVWIFKSEYDIVEPNVVESEVVESILRST